MICKRVVQIPRFAYILLESKFSNRDSRQNTYTQSTVTKNLSKLYQIRNFTSFSKHTKSLYCKSSISPNLKYYSRIDFSTQKQYTNNGNTILFWICVLALHILLPCITKHKIALIHLYAL